MPGPGTPVVRLTGVSKSFGHGAAAITALRAVNLAVWPGELVCLIGPSGSGKSTLLSVVGGLLAPDSGTAQVGGIDVAALPRSARARFRATQVGFVFQSFNLVPFLTARENLMLMASLSGQRRAAARLRADGLLEMLGLTGRSRQLPGQLSAGEQQRVAIARALINDPAVLLADEPTASLDTDGGQAVVELLAGQIHERGTAGLLVTHDPRMAGRADRIVRLTDGGLIEAVEVT
jgi:putative ABC transport system ATP-binding protein